MSDMEPDDWLVGCFGVMGIGAVILGIIFWVLGKICLFVLWAAKAIFLFSWPWLLGAAVLWAGWWCFKEEILNCVNEVLFVFGRYRIQREKQEAKRLAEEAVEETKRQIEDAYWRQARRRRRYL